MKTNYKERKENRLTSFERLATKNEQLSNDLYKQSTDMASCIPMGQPILVGHHSERKDRNFRAKIGNKMGASIEAQKKAAYYKERAESLLNGTVISSDDPDALDKLQDKLEKLTHLQELYKAINKIIRDKKTDIEKIEAIQSLGLKEETALQLITPDSLYGTGIPHFKLTNNNAVINNTRKRIEQLEKIAALPYSETLINGATLVINPDDNRVQIFFDSIPAESVRKDLKSSGFRWAPSVGAWMRQISNNAVWSANRILTALESKK